MSTPNALSQFLATQTTRRLPADYEAVFDDFIAFAGGGRLTDRYTPPLGSANADYLIPGEGVELVLELKQLATYRPLQTLDAYFNERLAAGKIYSDHPPPPGPFHIDTQDLSPSEQRRFYKRFRPSVGAQLDKAAQQLKATEAFLPPSEPGVRRLFGAVLLNSGDFGVSTDLLFRLAEWKAKDAWRQGRYSRIDFVTCLAMDMIEEERHPLHSRHLARNASDALLGQAIWRLFDRWVHYGAEAVGARVTFTPGPVVDPVRAGDRIRGKIQWTR